MLEEVVRSQAQQWNDMVPGAVDSTEFPLA